jgi:lysophospholipase L1-like esterase
MKMMNLRKRKILSVVLATFLCVTSAGGQQQTFAAESTEPSMATETPDIPEETVAPTETPQETAAPTEIPQETAAPTATAKPSPSPTPQKKIRLTKPKGVQVVQRTSSTITLKWKKVKNAKQYEIYCKKKGAKSYKKVAVTKKLTYKNKKRKAKTVYCYKVLAVTKDNEGKRIQSPYSKVKKVTTKPEVKKIAYVGDSVMCGMANYLNNKKKGRRVIGKIGISTWNFWRGEYMDKVLDYNPDRIYIMLGVNSLVGTPSKQHCDAVVADYKKIIRLCKKNNPNVEIIILSVAPCTATCKETSNRYINMYNKKQKKMAKEKGLLYFDFSSEFKDSTGYLKHEYNGGDGLHWSAAGCLKFKKLLNAYNKKLK